MLQWLKDLDLHSPAVIPPSALDKPSIMKCYHRRRTRSWDVTACLPTIESLHDTRFVECRWWNDGWTMKTVITWRSSASMIPAPDDGNGNRVCALELPRLTGLPVITGSHLNRFAEPVRVAANRCFGHSTRTKVTQVIFFLLISFLAAAGILVTYLQIS